RERRQRCAFAAERDIHRAKIRDHRHAGHRRDYRGFAELERRGRLSAPGGPRWQMENSMPVRADEAQARERDSRAAADIERRAAESAAQIEVERGNLGRADALPGGGAEQARAQARRIRVATE